MLFEQFFQSIFVVFIGLRIKTFNKNLFKNFKKKHYSSHIQTGKKKKTVFEHRELQQLILNPSA